jgi:two-component system sensor histidine kinase VanS
MKQESESSDMFPQEYAEIAAQMAEIRTAMLRSEQALRNEAAQKNDLVTYLAHDLKTPLTSVIGYLSLLDEAPDMPPEQKAKYTHIALDKANRLERLVNEFFEITRYNLQQITLEQEQIDLYYMLVQMVDEFYPILSAKGNTAVLHADEDLSVCGDPMKLARVFNNILKNAAAYSFPNSEIIISAEKKDKQMVISFENQGPTIPEEKLSKIFERFYRMDEARSSNAGGAGLGLAIAKEIVTLHHGTITAESHENATVFTVSLPITN